MLVQETVKPISVAQSSTESLKTTKLPEFASKLSRIESFSIVSLQEKGQLYGSE